MQNPNRDQHGFTLIEVLIALSILALTLAALARGSSQSTRTTEVLRDRAYAHWVAMDKATELYLKADQLNQWPDVGIATDTVKMGHIDWYVEITTSETPDKDLRRSEIAVSTEKDSAPVTTLFALIANPN